MERSESHGGLNWSHCEPGGRSCHRGAPPRRASGVTLISAHAGGTCVTRWPGVKGQRGELRYRLYRNHNDTHYNNFTIIVITIIRIIVIIIEKKSIPCKINMCLKQMHQ